MKNNAKKGWLYSITINPLTGKKILRLYFKNILKLEKEVSVIPNKYDIEKLKKQLI